MARTISHQNGRISKGRRIHSDYNGVATTRNLTRVIASIWDEPKNKNLIHMDTGIYGRRLDDALLWLKNHQIIERYQNVSSAMNMWRLREDHKEKLMNHIYKPPRIIKQTRGVRKPVK